MELAEQHTAVTGISVEIAVADSKYGTKENYLACHDAGIAAHIPEFKEGSNKRYKKRGLFMADEFNKPNIWLRRRRVPPVCNAKSVHKAKLPER